MRTHTPAVWRENESFVILPVGSDSTPNKNGGNGRKLGDILHQVQRGWRFVLLCVICMALLVGIYSPR